MSGPFFLLLAAVVGAAHAVLLARAAGREASPTSFVLRFALVAAVLVVSALAGQIVWGAGGWVAGFGLTAAVVYRRLG